MPYGHVLRSGLLGLGLLLFLSAQASLPRQEVWIARGTSQQEIAGGRAQALGIRAGDHIHF